MEAKPDPSATQSASSGPRLAQHETKLATNPSGQGDGTAGTTGDKTVTEKATEAASTAAASTTAAAAGMKDNVFSMFGGGSKEKKKEVVDEHDEEEESGSSKKKAAATGEDGDEAPESPEVEFTPVVHLTEKVETKTNEELEEQTFKMRAKLFKFDRESKEWKERGTGDVRLLKHKENGKTRLVMRRDKTLKVCANHYVVSSMKLSPNVGSDRSWVWTASADVSEGEPEAQTLAIRFANSDNANLFKDAFIKAQQDNEALVPKEAESAAKE